MRTFRPHVPASEVRTWQVTAAVFRHSRTAPARVRVARRRSGRAPALPGRPAPDPPPLRPTRVADARRAIAGAREATRPRRALAPTGRRRGRARLDRGQVLISPGRWCVTGSGHAESWGRHSRNRCAVATGGISPRRAARTRQAAERSRTLFRSRLWPSPGRRRVWVPPTCRLSRPADGRPRPVRD